MMKNIMSCRHLSLSICSKMAASGDFGNFVAKNRKVLGAAMNYMDIVKANNLQVPKEPLLFLKPTYSLIQEGENIIYPKIFKKVVHEVELGVIINKKCKNVSKEDAMSYVGGYCLALDLTAMCHVLDARPKGNPWTLGKSFDTSTPVSRFIPLSEIPDPHNVPLWLKVNGEMRQCGNTKDLIFNVADLIAYSSKYMTLEPNDLILTGTPFGSGDLKAGDLIECGLANVEMKFKVCEE